MRADPTSLSISAAGDFAVSYGNGSSVACSAFTINAATYQKRLIADITTVAASMTAFDPIDLTTISANATMYLESEL